MPPRATTSSRPAVPALDAEGGPDDEPAAATDDTASTAGWPAGFVAFYVEQYPAAVRTAQLILGRRDLAEDVV